MSTRSRSIRLVTFLSMTMTLVTLITSALVTPALAEEGNSAAEFCIYTDGRTDTPETGPLPCDTSRRYMIGHVGFGSSRIPADSEFSTSGPKSHLDSDTGASSSDAAGPSDDTMASPRTPDAEPSSGVQAP